MCNSERPEQYLRNVVVGITSHRKGWEKAALSSFHLVMADPFLLISEESRGQPAF